MSEPEPLRIFRGLVELAEGAGEWNVSAVSTEVVGRDLLTMIDEQTAELARFRLAAPVMLTVMALLADEADIAGLREIGLWYETQEPEHIKVWLDAERARQAVQL